jgi:hypothetical protein
MDIFIKLLNEERLCAFQLELGMGNPRTWSYVSCYMLSEKRMKVFFKNI